MKMVLFGATGHVGRAILNEAVARGHAVTAVVRDAARLGVVPESVRVVVGDVAQPATWREAVRGQDAVIASLSARRDGNHDLLAVHAQAFIDNLPAVGVTRLVWVGGAGSLEVAPGVRVVDTPDFPAAWRDEALGQGKALEVFRARGDALDWVYVSPAALLDDAEPKGHCRVGGEQLLVDAQGNSHIGVIDYAAGLLDQLDRPEVTRRRITLAD
ncbi:MAG TPA: NAD(P)H-binding protein [Rhodanobacteraceae bacterium]